MAKQTEELYFVEVGQPVEVKRSILETLRIILESLQRFEKFKELRHKKASKVAQLRKNIRDISKHINALKALVPEAKVREAPTPVVSVPEHHDHTSSPKKNKKKQAARREHAKRSGSSELDKLSAELAVIEEKLKGLQ